jgi:hypothetical protein
LTTQRRNSGTLCFGEPGETDLFGFGCHIMNIYGSDFSNMFRGLDHGIGHMASMSPEKNERLTSSKD